VDTLPTKTASPSPKDAQSLLDPQRAGYELLRRLICERAPLDGLPPEGGTIPDDLKNDIEFGSWTYQISVYIEIAKAKFGLAVSEKIRTHLVLLSGFDPHVESQLLRFFEAIRTTDGAIRAGCGSNLFDDDPALKYDAVLAGVILCVSGCPEERQSYLLNSVLS